MIRCTLLRAYSRLSHNGSMIDRVLKERMRVAHLTINDDSSKHMEADDSHFVVYIVSDDFADKSLIQRHKMVKNILKEEGVMSSIHALSIKTDTVEEYRHVYKDKADETLRRSGYDSGNK